jgi:hypothetical protein
VSYQIQTWIEELICFFDGNPDVVLLKPHLGVRAELYRNPVKADAEYKALFEK